MVARYIKRDIEPELKQIITQFPSLALTGPRQSGKSTTLINLFGKTHKYLTFDDPVVRNRALSDPKMFLDEYDTPVILDEIQYAPQILSYIKMNIDKNRNRTGRYIFTGSQRFNLIKNIGDSLAGRIALVSLFPFSYKELSKNWLPEFSKYNSKDLFLMNCLRGSYPELVLNSGINMRKWYSSYIQTYLERDISTIYNIGNLRDFQRFIQILAGRCSQKLNMNSLSSELGVSVNTVKSWVSILEASNIIYLLYPYYKSGTKRLVKTPKVYFIDTGLVCYLTSLIDKEHILNGPMAGALFENYCIQETIKQITHNDLNVTISYLSTYNNDEIDLLIEHDMKIYPFEIKLTKSPGTGMAGIIEKMSLQYNLQKGKIICLSDDPIRLSKNVEAINIQTFYTKILSSF